MATGATGAPEPDVNRAYNEFWRERGRITADRRTALIVDPADGRVPPLTAEAQKRAASAPRKIAGEFDGPEAGRSPSVGSPFPNAGPPMMPPNYNAIYQIVRLRES